MASNPILSTGVRQNLSSLQSIAKQTTTTESRLATGKKVNSAIDNPVNYFTSAALSDRASDLTGLLDGVSNAVQTLQAASNGIESITSLVKDAQSAAKQALQTTDSSSDAIVTLDNTSDLKKTTTLTSLGFEVGDKITLTAGTSTMTFTLSSSNNTVSALMKAMNDSSLDVKATLDSDTGNLDIEETGGEDLTVAFAKGSGTANSASDLADIFGLSAASTTETASTSTSRDAYRTQFNDILDQIDQMAKDAGYNGINLLQGDNVTVTFNEKTGKDKSEMTISGVSMNADGLGLDQLDEGAFQTNKGINDVLDSVTTALATLRSQASSIGSNLSVVQARQDFTNNMVSTLTTGSDNLVAADTNAESANLLALQTRQSLSTKALSLANQADQSVLNLFG